jgi:hypothetical protein
VFEQPYSVYASLASSLQQLVTSDINGYGRPYLSYMVSDVPDSGLNSFVSTISAGAQYLFCTDLNIQVTDIYASFGGSWTEFVGDITTSPATSIQDKP